MSGPAFENTGSARGNTIFYMTRKSYETNSTIASSGGRVSRLCHNLALWPAESRMAIESHLETLERKHGALEKEISEALASPATDDLKITDMKRRKLMLKEQIEKLRSTATRH
eukprot:gene1851-2279_t